jgi:hypothetical protein
MKLDIREYIHAIKSNNCNSGYANRILNTGQTNGTIVDKTGKEANT